MDLTMPFADKGDRVDFPAAKQGDNSMSLEQGFTSAYGLPPEEGGLFIDRQKFNQLMYLVSKGVIDNKTALESLTEKVNAIPGQIQSSISTLSGKYEEILPEKLTKFYIGPGKDDKFKDIDEAFYYIQRYSLNSGGNYIQLILRENFKFTKNYDPFIGLDLQNVIVSQENYQDDTFFYEVAMDGENQIYDYDKPGFFYFISCNCPDFRIKIKAVYTTNDDGIVAKYNSCLIHKTCYKSSKYVKDIVSRPLFVYQWLVGCRIYSSFVDLYAYYCQFGVYVGKNLSSTAFEFNSSFVTFSAPNDLNNGEGVKYAGADVGQHISCEGSSVFISDSWFHTAQNYSVVGTKSIINITNGGFDQIVGEFISPRIGTIIRGYNVDLKNNGSATFNVQLNTWNDKGFVGGSFNYH